MLKQDDLKRIRDVTRTGFDDHREEYRTQRYLEDCTHILKGEIFRYTFERLKPNFLLPIPPTVQRAYHLAILPDETGVFSEKMLKIAQCIFRGRATQKFWIKPHNDIYNFHPVAAWHILEFIDEEGYPYPLKTKGDMPREFSFNRKKRQRLEGAFKPVRFKERMGVKHRPVTVFIG